MLKKSSPVSKMTRKESIKTEQDDNIFDKMNTFTFEKNNQSASKLEAMLGIKIVPKTPRKR